MDLQDRERRELLAESARGVSPGTKHGMSVQSRLKMDPLPLLTAFPLGSGDPSPYPTHPMTGSRRMRGFMDSIPNCSNTTGAAGLIGDLGWITMNDHF